MGAATMRWILLWGAAVLPLAATGAAPEGDRTARDLGCVHLCGGAAGKASISELCRCVNWHSLTAEQLHEELEKACRGGDSSEGDVKWAATAGRDMLRGWARKVTGEVCTFKETGAPPPPCSFDAAVKVLYDKGGIEGKSSELQCAFALRG